MRPLSHKPGAGEAGGAVATFSGPLLGPLAIVARVVAAAVAPAGMQLQPSVVTVMAGVLVLPVGRLMAVNAQPQRMMRWPAARQDDRLDAAQQMQCTDELARMDANRARRTDADCGTEDERT